MFKNNTFVLILIALIMGVVGYGIGVKTTEDTNVGSGTRSPNGLSADTTSPVAGELRGTTLTVTSAATVAGLTVSGDIVAKETTTNLAPTNQYSTTTLTSTLSGANYLLSASGTRITLPAVSDGVKFKFTVKGAIDTANVVVASSEGDNINGSLEVAGVVTPCSGEDFVNIVYTAETIGDYVELLSDGTQWIIMNSFASSTGAMTCTDPS